MYINEIFELTRAVNSDEFDRLIARVRDNLEEEEGEEYADRSLSRKGGDSDLPEKQVQEKGAAGSQHSIYTYIY